ncbi:TraR/DksA C4-type zinc finger protein [Bacillus sp. ISL-47]|uniref:TraR/DksA C4-type zinc finger protein n=1 Tax=Bacillus sp. ISL-47 TaxID=2819130 RepID=UPI001BECF21A|nr:TraR/DksA C4-type zinc finger protein [Bacillus sp. ISL-47]MBT2686846.1 TraR/DksA C4-type zinc finger protein [Bacillus sp. ISL-47]MBT2706801.1 TraR/DksA C4-type zinc finger protein [Pseudomonas sp. ISL-84]
MPQNQTQFAEFRSALTKMKEDINKRQDANDNFGLKSDFFHESMGELSSYDNHPGDEGTELFEREKDIALHQHLDYELEKIEAALASIEKGTYGKCIACNKDIPLERLQAVPETLYCKEHSPDQTVSTNRPIEEGVLMPPFGKFDMDEQDENVAYDAEDSWQEVAKWGTSETPSDLAVPPEHYNDTYIEYDENVGYVEDYENFVGNDMYGKNVTVYPNDQHDKYEESLDEEGIMTSFGDLPAFEHDAYVDDDK